MLLLSPNSTQGWDRWKETVTRRALYVGRPRRAPGSCLGLAGLSLHSAHLSPFPKRFSSSHLRAFLGLTEYCCIAKINETPDICTTANDNDDSHKHLAKASTPSNIAPTQTKLPLQQLCPPTDVLPRVFPGTA